MEIQRCGERRIAANELYNRQAERQMEAAPEWPSLCVLCMHLFNYVELVEAKLLRVFNPNFLNFVNKMLLVWAAANHFPLERNTAKQIGCQLELKSREDFLTRFLAGTRSRGQRLYVMK